MLSDNAEASKTIRVENTYTGENVSVLFSLDDEYLVSRYRWRFTEKGYVENSNGLFMHRLIWEHQYGSVPEGFTVDHANRHKWDNRRENLRTATFSEQQFNRNKLPDTSSRYHHVSYSQRVRKWTATGYSQGLTHYIGIYDTEVEAAENVDRFHIFCPDFDVSFRNLNFPEKLDHFKSLGPLLKRARKNIRGVTFCKTHRKYKVCVRGHVKYFDDELNAAIYRDQYVASIEDTYKSPPVLNFPENFPDYGKKLRVQMEMSKEEGSTVFVECGSGTFVKLDRSDYELCKYYKLCLYGDKPHIIIDRKRVHFGKFLRNITDNSVAIEYDNGDKYDLRQANLNSRPRSLAFKKKTKKSDTSSQYCRVTLLPESGTWKGTVLIPRQVARIFKTEEYAARWVDLMYMIHRPGASYTMNFKWTPEDKLYWMQELKLDRAKKD